MASHAEADAAAPAQRATDSAWAKVALGALILLLVVEFVLPGFVTAVFSNAGPAFQITFVPGRGLVKPAGLRAVDVMLAPAIWLADHSQAIEKFYEWEYGVGRELMP
ncbi:MAG TPA: hypothetical protein VG733_10390 [Chthoniobacteraceae bacterium]|nr:hypothetical protein [Chthoniobacteraceae bacterium]